MARKVCAGCTTVEAMSIVIPGCDNSRTYVPEVRQYHGLVLPCFQLPVSTT